MFEVELSCASAGSDSALELGDDPLRQDFAELDAPLIERVDVPDHALDEHAVLVERDQLAEHFRRQPVDQDRVRGPVAFEHAVWHQRSRASLPP